MKSPTRLPHKNPQAKNSGKKTVDNLLLKKFNKPSVADIKEIAALDKLNRQIINDTPISIIVIDKNGRIVFVNEKFKELSESQYPIGKNIFEIPFFAREKLSPLYRKLLTKGISFKKEDCLTQNSKKEIKYLNINAVPLRNTQGKIEGAISMAVDITESIIAKIKLAELNAQLEDKVTERTQQLSEINDKLSKAFKIRTHFIADASHELRTPLSIIKLNLDIGKRNLNNDNGQSDIEDLFATVDHELIKVVEILDDLNMATLIDNDESKINIENIDLNSLIEITAKRLAIIAGRKKINIILPKDKKVMLIDGDKAKLEKLFLNIVRNAIKYGEKNGWVKINQQVDPTHNLIKINITDNGIGIPQDELPHIFDRFYRSSLSRKTGEGGFGLGLSICKWIVERHYGSIEVKSKVGKGSLFIIKLPLRQRSV